MTQPAPAFGPTDTLHGDDDMQYDSLLGDALTFDPTESVRDEESQQEQRRYEAPDNDNPYEEFLDADQPALDPTFLKPKTRGAKARGYERKVKGLFATGVKITVQSPATIADSAAMLMHGPQISEKLGDLAAENERVARAIDMLTEQSENPTLALCIAVAPFAMQVLRNHEREVAKQTDARVLREVRVPFTKRTIKIRFRIHVPRLPKRARNLTQEPQRLVGTVFTNPDIVSALRKQGINIVSE